jgi:hypothetical protein
MSSQPPDFPTEPPYHPQELEAVTPPQQPPQTSQGRQTLAQRIEGLTLAQTLALGIGVGCSVLLVACLTCSALGLALGRSNPTQGSGSAIAAIPTATDDATATAEPAATIGTRPTATTHAQPTNTPRSHATNTPCPSPCNPWGYNFNATGGRKITNPPPAFCSYFACIGSPPSYTTFWIGQGYVVECHDTQFSKTGGTSNSCLGHGGILHTLYSH